MKKILIPIDASEYSKHSVEKGLELAKLMNCDIELVHVIDSGTQSYPHELEHLRNERFSYPQYMEMVKEQAEALLKRIKESCDASVCKVDTTMLQGPVAKTLIDYIEGSDADMVIMGSHGMGSATQRLFMGSVTNKILHHVQKPVLIVR